MFLLTRLSYIFGTLLNFFKIILCFPGYNFCLPGSRRRHQVEGEPQTDRQDRRGREREGEPETPGRCGRRCGSTAEFWDVGTSPDRQHTSDGRWVPSPRPSPSCRCREVCSEGRRVVAGGNDCACLLLSVQCPPTIKFQPLSRPFYGRLFLDPIQEVTTARVRTHTCTHARTHGLEHPFSQMSSMEMSVSIKLLLLIYS